MSDAPSLNEQQRDQTALLHTINLAVARTEEQLKALGRDIEHMRNNNKMTALAVEARTDKLTATFDARLQELATREAVEALARRVEQQENNWTWLIRLVVGAPIAAALAYLGFVRSGK